MTLLSSAWMSAGKSRMNSSTMLPPLKSGFATSLRASVTVRFSFVCAVISARVMMWSLFWEAAVRPMVKVKTSFLRLNGWLYSVSILNLSPALVASLVTRSGFADAASWTHSLLTQRCSRRVLPGTLPVQGGLQSAGAVQEFSPSSHSPFPTVLGIGVYWHFFSSSHLGVKAFAGLSVQSELVLHSALEHAANNRSTNARMTKYRLIFK